MNRYQKALNRANGFLGEMKSILEAAGDAPLSEEKQTEYDELEAKFETAKTRAKQLKELMEASTEIKGMDVDVDGFDSDEGETPESKSMDPVYIMRFGEDSELKSAIMGDLVGRNYKQTLWEQEKAFGRYLRGGEVNLDRNDVRLLKMQVFPFEEVEAMLKAGKSISDIKATQVEAQGSLGGFAVPPQMQSEIIKRQPGYTVVRSGGAQVVNLDSSNTVEFMEYKPLAADTDERYVGQLRGEWGAETQDPNTKNFRIGMVQVNADLYTYKVPFSQSLVEDATNLVGLLANDIAVTLAIDEDEAFLTGDGVGKPMGILPGGLNANSLTEVNSGGASTLTPDGIKSLKRGIASQYRAGAVFVANSDTYGDIELFREDGATGAYLFPDLTENESMLNRRALESEVMPDVAANAFPLLFIDMSAYTIVERSGLTIARFQDSNTGINKVEFHIRRRVGGRLLKPWMGAVQKVAS